MGVDCTILVPDCSVEWGGGYSTGAIVETALALPRHSAMWPRFNALSGVTLPGSLTARPVEPSRHRVTHDRYDAELRAYKASDIAGVINDLTTPDDYEAWAARCYLHAMPPGALVVLWWH